MRDYELPGDNLFSAGPKEVPSHARNNDVDQKQTCCSRTEELLPLSAVPKEVPSHASNTIADQEPSFCSRTKELVPHSDFKSCIIPTAADRPGNTRILQNVDSSNGHYAVASSHSIPVSTTKAARVVPRHVWLPPSLSF